MRLSCSFLFTLDYTIVHPTPELFPHFIIGSLVTFAPHWTLTGVGDRYTMSALPLNRRYRV